MRIDKFVFICKTFKNDFNYLKRLLESFKKYNVQNIKMYIIFPKDDETFFYQKIGKKELNNIEIIYEERFESLLAKQPLYCNQISGESNVYSVSPIRSGYINQEIIKLAFHELQLAENYMPIDSDGEFLRPFTIDDFIAEDGYPYTILEEDNELKVDPVYWYEVGWALREKIIRKINKEIDYSNRVMITAHGFCILSSEVLSDFKLNFMDKKNYSYIRLMEIASYEFSWYNLWLLKTNIIPIHYREPMFKTFHTKEQLTWYKRQGITLSDIRRGYIGIVVNSNFQPGRGEENPLDYDSFITPCMKLTDEEYMQLSAKKCLRVIIKKIFKKLHLLKK